MTAAAPPSDPTVPAGDPARLREILLDILTQPGLTNGEAATADDFFVGRYDAVDSYHEAVLAAARYCWQVGDFDIVIKPRLTVVR